MTERESGWPEDCNGKTEEELDFPVHPDWMEER